MVTMTVWTPDDGEQAWHEERKYGIGGSDVAATMGLSPFKSRYELWLEKLDMVDPPEFTEEEQERMRWGHVLEPAILGEFAHRHPELHVEPGQAIVAMADAPWQRCTVDALAYYDGKLVAPVEVKTGNHRQLVHWKHGDVPVHYVLQCQWYMHIHGTNEVHVVALLDTSTYVETRLERDDELIADILEQVGIFWNEHVLGGLAPSVTGTERERRALASLPASDGEVAVLDPAWDKWLDRREEIDEQIKELRAERERIGNDLRAAMGEAEEAWLDGAKVATHRAPSGTDRSVDWQSFREDFPDAYAALVREKPKTRRLTFTKREED